MTSSRGKLQRQICEAIGPDCTKGADDMSRSRSVSSLARQGLLIAGLSLSLAHTAAAKPSLRDVPEIDNGLFAVGLAHEIRKKCPDISGRIFRAYGYLRALHEEARDLGYTDSEIEDHIDSDVEKDRLRARARALMKERGLTVDAQGYCALGRQEIAADTETGRLLRDKQ